MNFYRMIYIVRSPLSEPNIAKNVLKYGTGAINVDGCRIATFDGKPAYNYPKGAGGVYSHEYQENSQIAENWNSFSTKENNIPIEGNPLGRWPANSLFSSQPSEVLKTQTHSETSQFFKVIQGDDMTKIPQDLIDYLYKMITPTHVGGESLVILGGLNDHDFEQYKDDQWHGVIAVGTPTEDTSAELMRVMRAGAHLMLIAPEEEPTGYKGACQVEDTGFEIRDSIFWARECDPNNPNFMYMPKASRSEREKGTDLLPKKTGAEAVDREEGSAGVDNPRAGAGRTASEIGNFHPTVKPIGIMEWLARDVPKGEVVVDPFMGSGTMGIACVKTGHSYIGMELSPEYFAIADARIRHWNDSYNAWNAGTIESDAPTIEDEDSEEESEDKTETTLDLSSFLGL